MPSMTPELVKKYMNQLTTTLNKEPDEITSMMQNELGRYEISRAFEVIAPGLLADEQGDTSSFDIRGSVLLAQAEVNQKASQYNN